MNTTQKYHFGDCLDLFSSIPTNSIDLIIADPPYYKVVKSDWDNQWKTFQEYLDWLEVRAIEMKRVLKDNGSLYIFGDDLRIAHVQVMMDNHFNILNNMVWYKRNNYAIKGVYNYRKFASVSERILFYSLQNGTGLDEVMTDVNNFTTLRQYFKNFQEALGLTIKEINKKLGHRKAEHAFYWKSTQWELPTAETYKELCTLPLKNKFIHREYKNLRLEYEDLRLEYEDLRRTFNYTGIHEVFDIPIINATESTNHPTTKPGELIKRLIESSSNPGDTILDPFMGSGVVMEDCVKENRNFIGFDISDEWKDNYKKILDNKKEMWGLSKVWKGLE